MHTFPKYFKASIPNILIDKNKFVECHGQKRSKKGSKDVFGKKQDADAISLCRWLLNWTRSSSSGREKL